MGHRLHVVQTTWSESCINQAPIVSQFSFRNIEKRVGNKKVIKTKQELPNELNDIFWHRFLVHLEKYLHN